MIADFSFRASSQVDLIDYINCLISYLSYLCHYALGAPLPSLTFVLRIDYPKHRTKSSIDLRQTFFRKLPSILSSLLFLWKTISTWTRTNVQSIRLQIMQMISSLLRSNGVSVLRAVAYCWGGRKRRSNSTIFVRDHLGEIQALIDILTSLTDYTITDMIANMNDLIRMNDKVQR